MGMMNSKEFKRKVDEATSNSSLSNLRYVITEKPKWKVFKKKEVVPLPQYRSVKGCPCGNDGPCKQKVTPKGVTIHYPQKKKKFGAFSTDRRYKPPKIQKSYFSRLAPKSLKQQLSGALPIQTRFQTSMHINLPPLNLEKVNNVVKNITSIKRPTIPSLNLDRVNNAIKSLKSLKSLKSFKKQPKRDVSKEFMFMPFMFGKT